MDLICGDCRKAITVRLRGEGDEMLLAPAHVDRIKLSSVRLGSWHAFGVIVSLLACEPPDSSQHRLHVPRGTPLLLICFHTIAVLRAMFFTGTEEATPQLVVLPDSMLAF